MIILTIIFILIDLVSKYIVANNLVMDKGIRVIDDFLKITYVKNTGVAFSMFPDNKYFVLIVSLSIIIILVYYLYKNKPNDKISKIAYSLVLGGAIGNFINRCFNGYVIDFIDIRVLGYDYPIFNLADTFIVIGVILLMISTWRSKDENRS